MQHFAPALVLVAVACAAAVDPASYRLTGSGEHWDVSADDRVFDDLRPRYAEFFDVILDPSRTHEPDLRPLRRDMEWAPVDRRNYDALNAIAIGYFELNYRASASPGGPTYFADSTRAASLLAIPWRAYGEIQEGLLRDAILDFFEDAGTGSKLGAATTASRLGRIVGSLERKEHDAVRLARIRRLTARLTPADPGR